jgi:hypothetical protein
MKDKEILIRNRWQGIGRRTISRYQENPVVPVILSNIMKQNDIWRRFILFINGKIGWRNGAALWLI